jgi:hypothetical protein
MVSDFPLPCVCHTTPPLRCSPSFEAQTRFMMSSTVKNCW